jgi:hypothetical protein
VDGLEAVGHISGSILDKKCKTCSIDLTTDNAAKKNAKYYRSQCKKCRSKDVIKASVGNPKRQDYAREYIRRTGKVKQYPCELCSILCYKKYARAFCSDKCRFMAYVEKTDTCWIWKGPKNRGGYGKLCFKDKKTAIASRVSYELFNGPIEEKMYICHLCDVPSCVNPGHLWVGSHMENMMDMTEKDRHHSVLLPMDVFEIRRLWQCGVTNDSLCKRFNITSGHVSNIINRRIWKHI